MPPTTYSNTWTIPRIITAVVAAIIVVIGLMSIGALVEHLAANEIMVIQAPFSGKLSVYTQPGVYWQGFGTVTHYSKREQFSFSSRKDQGGKADESLKVRFNDGGHANISGVISWEMPTATEAVVKLHTLFGSQSAIEQQLVRPAIERAVYLTGPLMSSAESYAARRNELLRYFEDQARDGIYQTETISVKMPDPVTGQEKTVQVVRLVMDGANAKRQGASPLREFGIILLPPSINEITYDPIVEQQIKEQQGAAGKVQIAMANAREAEQRKLTTEKNGQANAAQAKWEQETISAREVTAAEQRKKVAELDAQAAEQVKRRLVLEGQGEAEKRSLIMAADGGLDKKIEAVVKIATIQSDAVAKYQGSWVPQIVTGGGTASGPQSAFSMLDILSTKAARDLAIDLKATGEAKTSGKK